MSDAKSQLRKKLILKRKKKFSNKIIFSFEKLNYLIKNNIKKKKIIIGFYYPTNFEVNIIDSLDKIKIHNFTACLPKILKNYNMVFKKWNFNCSTYLNKYGIPEPNSKNQTLKPDVVLVPLVGYDKKLNRLGYGAGYYDRYLKKLSTQKSFLAIGVGFSFQEHNNIPVDKNDFSLDYILNEKKIIYKTL